MISTKEHREPDLQTKAAIYLGLARSLRGYENKRLSCHEYGELYGLHNPQRQLDTRFKQSKMHHLHSIYHVRFV
jgi:hypothetical protein